MKVRRKIQAASDDFDKLMNLVKKRKQRWFVHVSMSSGLAKTILQGTLKDKRRGIQKRRWGDNLKVEEAWTFASSIRAAETVQGGKGLLQFICRATKTFQAYEIEKNKIEFIFK